MNAFALMTFLDFVQAIVGTEDMALVIARLKYAYLLLVPTLFLHLSSSLSDNKIIIYSKRFMFIPYLICVIFFILSISTDTIVSGVTLENNLYSTDWGFLLPILMLGTIVFLISGLIILIITFKSAKNREKKNQLKYIFYGMTITAIVYLGVDQVSPAFTGREIEGSIIFTLPMFFFYVYAISKYKLMSFPKLIREKDISVEPIDYDLESGYTYIIPEQLPKKGFQLFKKTLKEGAYGICISMSDPKPIRLKHGLKDTPIIWITDEETEELSVKRSEIASINDILEPFLEKSTESVIFLIDDKAITSGVQIEDHSRILDISNSFFETIGKSNSTFIISVKPTSISPKNRLPIIKTKTPLLEFSRLAAFIFEEICNNILQFLIRNGKLKPEKIKIHLNNLGRKDSFFKKLHYRKSRNPINPNNKLKFTNILVAQRLSKQILIDKIKLFVSEFEAIETAINLNSIVESSIKKYGLSKNEFLLHIGDTYIIPDSSARKSFEILSEFTMNDYKGLCITKSNPKKLMRKYSMLRKGVKVYWLTDITETKLEVVPPKLEHLLSAIEEFLASTREKKIILLDGIEYLIFYSGDIFDAVLGFMRRLTDRISETNAMVIIQWSLFHSILRRYQNNA
jgi:hypothetical protein